MVWQKYYILKCALFSNIIHRYLFNRMNYNIGNMFSVTMIIFLHSLSYVALESKKLQDPKHVTFTQISLPISISLSQMAILVCRICFISISLSQMAILVCRICFISISLSQMAILVCRICFISLSFTQTGLGLWSLSLTSVL